MRSPVTIRDIAAHLGISHATVSRVLNGKGADFISQATRKRVLEASEQLGYRRNYHARALHLGRADAIGVPTLLMAGQRGWRDFWGRLIDGIAETAAVRGKEMVGISWEKPGEDVIERCLLRLQERRIDCLVLPGVLDYKPHAAAFKAVRAAVVVAQPYEDRAGGLSSVRLDAEPGILAAFEHLVALGHRRIVWLGPNPNAGEVKRRRVVYRAAMAARGFQAKELGYPEPSGQPPGGEWPLSEWIRLARKAFADHLAAERAPTAVLAYNEVTAQGVIAAAAERGLRVPQDLSVIGFDDIHAAFAIPPMTVVSHQLHEIGVRAAELALEMTAEGGSAEPRDVLVPAQLVVRESTARAKD